jgi:putative transposase
MAVAHAKCFGIMARRARVEYTGALYHVIARGNQRQKIFYDDRDRTKYLELLSRADAALPAHGEVSKPPTLC